MSRVFARLVEAVEAQGAAALVRVHAVRGSAPREEGAALVVRPDGGFWGTIGGGALEFEAIAAARRALDAGRGPALVRDWPLGPDLGQCCGGSVTTLTERFDARDLADLKALAAREADERPLRLAARMDDDGRVVRGHAATEKGGWTEAWGEDRSTLLLFGAGHVGRALVLALAPLPVDVTWIDGRPDAFPSVVPANVTLLSPPEPAAVVADAPPGAAVMVMTHDHALDLAVVAAALRREDLGPVGLIGSATKRARFLSRLRDAGLADAAAARLVCPIGVTGITGKEPAVIAAAAAAQVLQWREEATARARLGSLPRIARRRGPAARAGGQE
ncbi:xanthine dehydrogenase accessory protein XdhC [Alsobacter sp. R-9]